MKKFEDILDHSATSRMKDWNLQVFKKSHPVLFAAITEAIGIAYSEGKTEGFNLGFKSPKP